MTIADPISHPDATPPRVDPLTPPVGDVTGTAGGAYQTIKQTLDAFGLGSLASWAWGRWQAGASLDQIMIELYQQPEFKAVYPEYEDLAKQGYATSVAELQAYRKAIIGIGGQYGLPDWFLTPSVLSDLARNQVSVAEVSQRFAQYAQAAYESPPEFRQALHDYYGVTQGELIAFFADPQASEQQIKQRWTAAQIGGTAQRSGYGLLTQDEAQRLAGQGVDQQAAQQGFGALTQNRELFGAINRGETNISQDIQFGAAFGGDVQAQQTIERRRQSRQAEFQAGGGFATSREGIVGA